MDQELRSRGFQGDLRLDPPAVWKGHLHDVDELVMLAERKVKFEMKGSTYFLKVGEECFIPANTYHTVRNGGKGTSHCLYSCNK